MAISQPRRVAAVNLARRVAEEMNVELGTTVGYAIRYAVYPILHIDLMILLLTKPVSNTAPTVV